MGIATNGARQGGGRATDLHSRVVALGVPCGGFPGTPMAPGMNIRLGGDYVPVGRAAFAAWWQLLRPRRIGEISDWLEAHHPGAGADAVAELHALRVIVPWHADPLADLPTFAPLRLVPIGLGMGQSMERPGSCTVSFGFAGGQVSMGSVPYGVWARCDGRVGLGEACRLVAAAVSLHVDEVWAEFHPVLPELTAGGMALIDR